MGKITAIEPQKRNKNRYTIYVDHQFFSSLDEEIIVRNHLKIGAEVDDAYLKTLIYENDLKHAFNKSLSYLSYRSRSRKEMISYLEGKGYDQQVIEKTLEKLFYYRFVDDEDFAKRWVNDRKFGKMVGRRVIQQELHQKGIDEEIIAQALQNISEEDELKKAMRLAERYLMKYSKLERRERAFKTSQALARKGFPWETIRRALRKADQDMDIMDD